MIQEHDDLEGPAGELEEQSALPAMTGPQFNLFYADMHPRVFRFIQARLSVEAAEDLAHDTMLTLWLKQPPQPSDSASLRQLRAFAYRIASGHIRNAERKLAKERRLAELLAADPVGHHDHVEDPISIACQPSRALNAINELAESDRELLALDVLGFKARDVAEILSITPKAASMRLARAKSRAAKKMNESQQTGNNVL